MSFKQAKPINPITFLDSDIVYIWDDSNPNDINFKKVIKDYQSEINNHNGCDLKSLVAKNIIPNSDRTPIYVDDTIYKDVDSSKLYDLSQYDVIIDDETGEALLSEVPNENKNTESFNKSSSKYSDEVESLSGEKK